MRLFIGGAIILLISSQPIFAQDGAANPAQAWWAHVQFLADDKMAGRDTGSPEHRQAADYVAAAFKRAGLKPAGTKGYLQPVNFVSRRVLENECSMALIRNGQSDAVALGDEAVFSMCIGHAPLLVVHLVVDGYSMTITCDMRDNRAV